MFTTTTGVLIVGIISLIVYFVKKYLDRNSAFWENKGIPTLKLSETVSMYQRLTMKFSFMEMDKKVYDKFGDIKYGGYIEFGTPIFYVKDLDLLKNILVKSFDHFVDRRRFDVSKADKIVARMMTNLTGKEWKDLRSVMSPTFTTGRIRRMFQFFNICGQDMANYIRDEVKVKKDNVLDIQDTMGRFTLSAIASIAFGLQVDTFTGEESYFRKMSKRFQTFTYFCFFKVMVLILIPKLAKILGLSFTDQESMEFFEGVIMSSIKQRREDKDGGGGDVKRNDFLQMMLEAQAGQLKLDLKELDAYEKDAILDEAEATKKYDVVLDDATILSQSILFFLAGADTLESTLTFVSYALALNPEVQEKLAQEVTQSMDENEGKLTYDSTQSMQYLDMVLSESLRMYPPAFATERTCTTEFTVPDTNIVIPKGSRVVVPINGIQHDPKHYENPYTFNPENFSPENKAKRHPYTWLPFGQGPRNCIAMRFALTEAKAAIAHLVYNFKVEPCEKTQIPLKLSTKTSILKPENGLQLKFTARENNHDEFVKL